MVVSVRVMQHQRRSIRRGVSPHAGEREWVQRLVTVGEVEEVEVEVDVGQRRGWAGTLPGRAVYFYLQVLGIYSRLCCCDPYPLAWWVMVIVRKQVLTPSCHTRVAGSETSVQPPSALAIVRLSTRVLDRLKVVHGKSVVTSVECRR